MSDEETDRRPGLAVIALITIRFLLELALWASFTVSSLRLIEGPVGWFVGLGFSALVMTLWAVLLSPRRPVRLPISVRVAIELMLFALASSLLAAAGLASAGVALLALELLDLGLLHGPDKHAL